MAELNVAKFIDHTLLKPDARWSDLQKLCDEAIEYGFYSVCVQSVWVKEVHDYLAGRNDVKVAAVCGFPHGVVATEAKVAEAKAAVDAGAVEIDMVLPVGWLLEQRFEAVQKDIAAVVDAVKGKAGVKVIFETGFLTPEFIREACQLSVAAGAAFVKTSTGFGPGGATVEAITLMRETVGTACGVKASGGVRDLATAKAMIAAGATRIGTSSGVTIVQQVVNPTAATTNGGAY